MFLSCKILAGFTASAIGTTVKSVTSGTGFGRLFNVCFIIFYFIFLSYFYMVVGRVEVESIGSGYFVQLILKYGCLMG